VEMHNIIARFRKDASHRILIGAHWDTRPYADVDPDSTRRGRPFDGANDGASGVAVLLEVARALKAVPPHLGVDLVLFDGEDGGEYGVTPGNWCLGSRYLASHLPLRYEWGIILDMVGSRTLRLPPEGYSRRLAGDAVKRVWSLAAREGHTAFVNDAGPDVFDDHIPFLMRGIKVIDIIDFNYPYWHTAADAADKCAPASLGTVGRVVLAAVAAE